MNWEESLTMSARRKSLRQAGAAALLAGALMLPATAAHAQATPTRPAPTATRPAVSGSPAAGEPAQDMAMLAGVMAFMVLGGGAMLRFATRRAS
jgi:hypothetical protein